MKLEFYRGFIALTALAFIAYPINVAAADEIQAEAGNADPPFDIVQAKIVLEDNWLVFSMEVSGQVGASTPEAIGDLAGSSVSAYVWPTTIGASDIGFEHALTKKGILALAVTTHPDFDDTPLFDENADGDLANDGDFWHSHWVVLVPDDACGEGSLKVMDIPEGTNPRMPKTWPGLPLMIDSPGYTPLLNDNVVKVRVPFDNRRALRGISYDGVTSGLRINAEVRAPLLCIVDVFDVASGDLSLPGKIN
jgi:hypothetical protein